MSSTTVNSLQQYKDILSKSANTLLVLLFWASWHEPSKSQLDVINKLSNDYNNIQFISIDVDETSDVVELYENNIQSVPTYLVIRNNHILDTIEGIKTVDLLNSINKYSKIQDNIINNNINNNDKPIEQRLHSLINLSPVMLFMKGNPDNPRCGFSRQMIDILKQNNIKFNYFDILSDQTVRDELKKYSNWPTYPQLYSCGKLVGGLDVVKELIAEGEFSSVLPHDTDIQDSNNNNNNNKQSLTDHLEQLINRDKVMLFMKGDRDQPRCGFSAKTIELLNRHNIQYSTFDILQDDNVRQGLKTYSNWPTYPQLYVNGKLVGGIDVLKELEQEGELESTLNA